MMIENIMNILSIVHKNQNCYDSIFYFYSLGCRLKVSKKFGISFAQKYHSLITIMIVRDFKR
jgi:hypothetical protein